jgi:hypothetical protein
MDIKSLLGKKEEEVVNELEKKDKKHRIVKRDNEAFATTMDYDENRANLEIEAGVVVHLFFG